MSHELCESELNDTLCKTAANQLHEDCIRLSNRAVTIANIYKAINIISIIFITISGAVVGILALEINKNYVTYLIASILGFSITVVRTLMSVFGVEKRAVLIKDTANRLRRIARAIKTLQNTQTCSRDFLKLIENYYAEVDELDIGMIDMTINRFKAISV